MFGVFAVVYLFLLRLVRVFWFWKAGVGDGTGVSGGPVSGNAPLKATRVAPYGLHIGPIQRAYS